MSHKLNVVINYFAIGTSEYISGYKQEKIRSILTHHFPTHRILTHFDDNKILIEVQVIELIAAPCERWRGNRPHDETRCREIADWYSVKSPVIDTIITTTWNNQTKVFEILDGLHRFHAMQLANMGHPALLYVRFNDSDGDKIEVFQNINKSVPVTEMWLVDPQKEKQLYITAFIKEFKAQYEPHFKPRNPKKPNTTQNLFEELCSGLYDKHHVTSQAQLCSIIMNANHMMSEINYDCKKAKQVDKCAKTGCYLFMCANSELLETV